MNFQIIKKESFVVIGKEGSTKAGEGFIQKLWNNANDNFHEVSHLSKKDNDGTLMGVWGAMSDFSRSYLPWEVGFTQGLYLAGVECIENAQAPKGWTKWVIPGYEYLSIENNNKDTFLIGLHYLKEHQLSLVGAVQEFNCPKTGKSYLFFPIHKL